MSFIIHRNIHCHQLIIHIHVAYTLSLLDPYPCILQQYEIVRRSLGQERQLEKLQEHLHAITTIVDLAIACHSAGHDESALCLTKKYSVILMAATESRSQWPTNVVWPKHQKKKKRTTANEDWLKHLLQKIMYNKEIWQIYCYSATEFLIDALNNGSYHQYL